MRKALFTGLGTALVLFAAAPTAPLAAQQSEEAAVEAVVVRLFDGMRARDTTMMRSVFADEARFYGTAL